MQVIELASHSEGMQLGRDALVPEVGFRGIIGRSAAILAAIEKARRYSNCHAAVLITGETGTGKEVFARAIHDDGLRTMHPFVAVNCATLPGELVENELFGHEAGAFTGARGAKPGLIPKAESGTLFLDEIDSLPLFAQAKLLRFLEEGEYRPLGATHSRRADVRVIGATNRDLAVLTHNGHFRQDLYFRLSVLSLKLPPLRHRREDIALLANHLLQTHGMTAGRERAGFSAPALKRLVEHDWPGNVRELKNVVQQALVLSTGALITPEDLAVPVVALGHSFKQEKARAIEAFERDYLRRVLVLCEGNISQAAAVAGEHRRSFKRLLRKHALLLHTHAEPGVSPAADQSEHQLGIFS
jgi:DNA-binding NtrC family response regulator